MKSLPTGLQTLSLGSTLFVMAFSVACSLLGAGIVFLLTRPPAGKPIELRPVPTPLPVTVHVSGAVLQPGVYALPQGSRVQEAIQAAGGFLAEADDQDLNLAAFVSDGEKLVVKTSPPTRTPSPTPRATITPGATKGETTSPGKETASTEATPSERSSQTPAGSGVDNDGLIDINTASLEALDTLPGIGPVIAQRIIDYRTAHGPFVTIEAIMDVSGIGPATFEKIKALITVEN